MLGFFRQQRTTGKVRELVRRGVGVREAIWELPAPEAQDGFIAQVRSWLEECGAQMGRPNGVDHVALALSCRDRAGAVRCSASFGIRPLAEYLGPTGERELRGFLRDARFAAPGEGGVVKAVLLSMGDLIVALESAA